MRTRCGCWPRGRRSDATPDGLAPVGIFVCRARGEVFLTDDDLANFEKHQGVLALVVAGGRAGFFVREPDGSVQAIRSHEEFKVADAASRPVPRRIDAAAELPAPRSAWWQARLAWKRVAACAALLAVPAGAFAYLRPLLPQSAHRTGDPGGGRPTGDRLERGRTGRRAAAWRSRMEASEPSSCCRPTRPAPPTDRRATTWRCASRRIPAWAGRTGKRRVS